MSSLIPIDWDKTLLLDYCPGCDRDVDPLMQVPWHCNECGSAVFQPPGDWISMFKRPFSGVEFAGSENVAFALEAFSSAATVQDFYWTAPRDELRQRRAATTTQIMEWVREEVGVLLDTVMASHQDCILGEFEASLIQYHRVRFKCPVAGALACTASFFDISVAGDYWAPGERPKYDNAGSLLAFEVENIPALSRRLFVRETFRAWMFDAVSKFVAAEARGSKSLNWRPTHTLNANWYVSGNHHICLKSHCDWQGFSRLVSTYHHKKGLATTAVEA